MKSKTTTLLAFLVLALFAAPIIKAQHVDEGIVMGPLTLQQSEAFHLPGIPLVASPFYFQSPTYCYSPYQSCPATGNQSPSLSLDWGWSKYFDSDYTSLMFPQPPIKDLEYTDNTLGTKFTSQCMEYNITAGDSLESLKGLINLVSNDDVCKPQGSSFSDPHFYQTFFAEPDKMVQSDIGNLCGCIKKVALKNQSEAAISRFKPLSRDELEAFDNLLSKEEMLTESAEQKQAKIKPEEYQNDLSDKLDKYFEVNSLENKYESNPLLNSYFRNNMKEFLNIKEGNNRDLRNDEIFQCGLGKFTEILNQAKKHNDCDPKGHAFMMKNMENVLKKKIKDMLPAGSPSSEIDSMDINKLLITMSILQAEKNMGHFSGAARAARLEELGSALTTSGFMGGASAQMFNFGSDNPMPVSDLFSHVFTPNEDTLKSYNLVFNAINDKDERPLISEDEKEAFAVLTEDAEDDAKVKDFFSKLYPALSKIEWEEGNDEKSFQEVMELIKDDENAQMALGGLTKFVTEESPYMKPYADSMKIDPRTGKPYEKHSNLHVNRALLKKLKTLMDEDAEDIKDQNLTGKVQVPRLSEILNAFKFKAFVHMEKDCAGKVILPITQICKMASADKAAMNAEKASMKLKYMATLKDVPEPFKSKGYSTVDYADRLMVLSCMSYRADKAENDTSCKADFEWGLNMEALKYMDSCSMKTKFACAGKVTDKEKSGPGCGGGAALSYNNAGDIDKALEGADKFSRDLRNRLRRSFFNSEESARSYSSKFGGGSSTFGSSSKSDPYSGMSKAISKSTGGDKNNVDSYAGSAGPGKSVETSKGKDEAKGSFFGNVLGNNDSAVNPSKAYSPDSFYVEDEEGKKVQVERMVPEDGKVVSLAEQIAALEKRLAEMQSKADKEKEKNKEKPADQQVSSETQANLDKTKQEIADLRKELADARLAARKARVTAAPKIEDELGSRRKASASGRKKLTSAGGSVDESSFGSDSSGGRESLRSIASPGSRLKGRSGGQTGAVGGSYGDNFVVLSLKEMNGYQTAQSDDYASILSTWQKAKTSADQGVNPEILVNIGGVLYAVQLELNEDGQPSVNSDGSLAYKSKLPVWKRGVKKQIAKTDQPKEEVRKPAAEDRDAVRKSQLDFLIEDSIN